MSEDEARVAIHKSPLPWSIAPLDGKYYGTEIIDADGGNVCTLWDHDDDYEPSSRERAKFNEMSDAEFVELWKDYCCDTHYESAGDLANAERIVSSVNRQLKERHAPPVNTP